MSTVCLVDGNAVAYTIDLDKCKTEKDFLKSYLYRLREYAKQFTSLPKFILFFDSKSGGNWREKIYPDYQKGRRDQRDKYTPKQKEDAKRRSQYLDFIKHCFDSSKYKYISYPHTETDDLLALYCNNIQKDNETAVVLTTDKDLFQLIRSTGNRKVQVLFLIKRQLIKDEELGKKALKEKIWLGDNSDSIPGVCKNVGKVTFPDFYTFIEKMKETNTDPTDKSEAKRISESLGIKYIPSFSNFDAEQLSLNRKLIDLSYVVELDKQNNNEKTQFLQENAEKAKFSPFALFSMLQSLT